MSISTSEAVRRVEAIVPMLADDVLRAIELHQTMEAANEIVALPLRDRRVDWAEPFSIIQNTLSLMLAMNLARIFDVSSTWPLDKQDKASIPILAHHLGQADVQHDLVTKAQAAGNYPGP